MNGLNLLFYHFNKCCSLMSFSRPGPAAAAAVTAPQSAAETAALEAAVGADVSDADWAACVNTAEMARRCSVAVNDGAGDDNVDDDVAEGERFWMTPLSAG